MCSLFGQPSKINEAISPKLPTTHYNTNYPLSTPPKKLLHGATASKYLLLSINISDQPHPPTGHIKQKHNDTIVIHEPVKNGVHQHILHYYSFIQIVVQLARPDFQATGGLAFTRFLRDLQIRLA